MTPFVIFVSFYVATLFAGSWLRMPSPWAGLIGAALATYATIAIWEGGRWDLGLVAPPAVAVRELASGAAFGAVLVLSCAAAVVLSTDLVHLRGHGFPWIELLVVYVPAVVHEELLFRGYPLQKLLGWNRPVAILLISVLFAALHGRNSAVTALALANIFLGGVLLCLAYERFRRLWFPIGLHLAWNVVAGPILGHEVSGHRPASSVLSEAGNGVGWMTGGAFGIEGSVWMTAAEVIGIAVLARTERRGRLFE